MFSNVFISLLMILNKREKIENWAKIRGWDVFSIVFKKIENFSLNVFINIVFIKKKISTYSSPTSSTPLLLPELPAQIPPLSPRLRLAPSSGRHNARNCYRLLPGGLSS